MKFCGKVDQFLGTKIRVATGGFGLARQSMKIGLVEPPSQTRKQPKIVRLVLKYIFGAPYLVPPSLDKNSHNSQIMLGLLRGLEV